MKRTEHWPTKLALFIDEKRDQPFDWKLNNCGFFACDWIAMLVGVDPAEEFRKLDDRALRKLIVKSDIELFATAAAEHWGWKEVAALYAQRGDVVSGNTPDGPALGVCCGAKTAFAGKNGLVWLLTGECRKAWRIE